MFRLLCWFAEMEFAREFVRGLSKNLGVLFMVDYFVVLATPTFVTEFILEMLTI